MIAAPARIPAKRPRGRTSPASTASMRPLNSSHSVMFLYSTSAIVTTGSADFAALLPRSPSKADKISAATTRRPRRNIARRDIVLCVIPLTPVPLGLQAMLIRELIPSLGSEFDETASRATISSARSGRNKCGNSVCQAATSASAIALRIRLPCPGKRRSYRACSRALRSRTATANRPR